MGRARTLAVMVLLLIPGLEAEAGLDGDEIVVSERFPAAQDVRNPQRTVVEAGDADAVTTPGQNATTIDVDPDSITLTLGCNFSVCNRITSSASFNGIALSDLDWAMPPGPPIGFEVESSGFFDPARVELRPREILIDLIFSAWQDGDSIRIVPVFSPQVAIDLRSTPAPRTGHIGVAILGSEEIDVREVDLASLRFGPGEATLASADSKPQWLRAKLSDVNRDGETDLDVSFSAADAELPSDAEEACLRGRVGALAFLACAPLEGWRGR